MNIHVRVFEWIYVLFLLGILPSNGIAGSYGNSMFNILRNCQTILQSACTILYSYQQQMEVPISTHLHQHLRSVILIMAILVGLKWSVSDTEHLFMCLLLFVYLLWTNVCSNPLPIFQLGYLLSCKTFSYILEFLFRYSQLLVFLVVMFYKVPTGTKPLLLLGKACTYMNISHVDYNFKS